MKPTTIILIGLGAMAAVVLLALIGYVPTTAQELPSPYPPSLPTFVTLQPFPVTPPAAPPPSETPYPQGSPLPPPDGPVATATATPTVVTPTPTPEPETTITTAEIINLCHTPNPSDAGDVPGQYWYSTDPCGGHSCNQYLVGSLYYDPQLGNWTQRYIVYVCVDFTTGQETCDWGLTAIGQPTLPPPYVMYCSWPGNWGGATPLPPPLP